MTMTVRAPRDGRMDLGAGRVVGIATYGDPDGYPVLALHGAPASRLLYAPADEPARRLGLRIVAPDRPGYGLTPPQTGRSLADTTDLHASIADACGFNRFAAIGISGGAPYAVALAERLGSRVSALALVSPLGPVAGFGDGPGFDGPDNEGGDLVQRHERRGRASLFELLPRSPLVLRALAGTFAASYRRAPHALTRAFGIILGTPDKQTLAREPAASNLPAMTLEALRSGVDGALEDMAIYRRPWGLDPTRIVAPSILWQGTADPMVPIPAAFALGRLISGCRVEPIPGAGHFWVYEHVAEVLASVAALLAHDPDWRGSRHL